MHILAKRLVTCRTYKKSARIQIALAEIKTLDSLHIIKLAQGFVLLVRLLCHAFFERISDFFIDFFNCAVFFFASACTQCIRYRWPDTMR